MTGLRKQLTCHRLVVVYTLAQLCFLMTACERQGTLQPGETPGSPSAMIRVLGEDSSNIQAMEALNKEHPFSDARVEFSKHSFEDAMQKANVDFAQKTGLYDIVLQYNFSLSSFARNRYVFTVDELKELVPTASFDAIEADLFPHVWREIGWYKADPQSPAEPDKVGYPFAANTMLLVMNQRLFNDPANITRYKAETGRELAAPQTWPEFEDLAKFFTDRRQGIFGVCLQGQSGGWQVDEFPIAELSGTSAVE